MRGARTRNDCRQPRRHEEDGGQEQEAEAGPGAAAGTTPVADKSIPLAAPVWIERDEGLRASVTGLFYPAVAKGQAVAAGAFEAVFVRDGLVIEGASSNTFAS